MGGGRVETLRELVDLVGRLREPDGCPWDREQRLADLRAYLLEEAHELAAALDRGDWAAIAGELGDLLFQTAFVGRLGEEVGALRIEDAVAGVHAKMVERHPHVFGGPALADAREVQRAWERQKAATQASDSLLGGVPDTLPALVAAYRLGQKAAGVGFDWPATSEVLAKVDEELDELRAVLAADSPDPTASAEELGDLLFALANLGRHLGHDPEGVLAAANLKFRRRFRALERLLEEEGESFATSGLERLEALWQRAKAAERSAQEEP